VWARFGLGAAVLAVAASAAPVSAQSVGAAESAAANAGVLAVLSADPVAVRAVGHVPSRWNLMLDSAGKASLILFMYDGDVIVGTTTRHYQFVTLSAMLDSSKLPAGVHSTSDADGLPSDLYLLGWSTRSAQLARWLRSSGLGAETSYVPGLDFNLESGPAPKFNYAAPKPDPSPFTFASQLTPTFLPTSPDTVDYWRDTASGTVMIETNDNNEQLGGFVQWTFQTDPASPLARMLGTTTQTATCKPTDIAGTILGLATHQLRPGCISREAFTSTSLRRVVYARR
jgi:hypothetical protein